MLETQRHLTKWLPIAVPLDAWIQWPPPFGFPPAALGPLGVFPIFFKLYDAMAKFRCPSSYIMSGKKSALVFPQLDQKRIKYCQVFYEGQHNDARTNLATMLTAGKHGGEISNYTNVESLLRDASGRVNGAVVRDMLHPDEPSFEIRCKQVLFCGGPFTDELRDLEDPNGKPAVAGAEGIHVVLPSYYAPR